MPTPPENRDPAEPSPWSEWLARRDEQQAGQQQVPEDDQPSARPPVYDPESYRRPAQPEVPATEAFPGQPDPYRPQYYRQPEPYQAPPQPYRNDPEPPTQYQPTQYQPTQPYQEQPYTGPEFAGRPQAQYSGTPYQDQYAPAPEQYPGQPYAGQQYPGQPYPGQPYAGQQYPGQQYPAGYPDQFPGPADPYAPPGGRRRSSAPLVAGIAAVVLALAVGGYVMVQSLRGPNTASPSTIDAGDGSSAAAASPSESGSPSPSDSASAEVSEATDVPADDAEKQLEDAGVDVSGDIRLAKSWTDANGGNLLVASRIVTEKDGDRVTAATIKVWQVTHTDTDPKVARTMTDPSGDPCDLDFDSDVDTGAGFVKDLDGDGIAEASVAWHRSCRGDVGPSLVKVAVLSDGNKYILRGEGYPQGRPDDSDLDIPQASVKQVDPAASQWPDGVEDAARDVFTQLYGG